MGLLRMLVRGIGLISTVILARLLVPADFGLVAMATSIIAGLELATAFSFDIPLIQKQDAERSYFDSAWTITVLFYAALTLILVLLAPVAAAFYKDERLEMVIYALAVGFFAQGFENIGIVYFRKELDFRKDFILMLSKKLGGFLVTVPLAYFLRSYWALIAGIVVGNIWGVALSYFLHPFRPRFSLVAVRHLFDFSKWLMLNNVVYYLRARSPDFVIGRVAGTTALGIFTVAHEISTLATTELVAPINRAVFPGYSKLASDLAELRRSFLDVLVVIAAIALPAALGIASVAAPLVNVFLGAKWTDVVPIVSILAVYDGVTSLQANTGAVFNALGKPHLATKIGTVDTLVLLASSIILVTQFGAIGVAWAYLGTVLIRTPFVFWYVGREIQARIHDYWTALWRPSVCSLLMYAVVRGLATLTAEWPSWVQLFVLSMSGAAFYVLAMIALWILSGRPPSADYRLAMTLLSKLRLNGASAPAS
jgi:lipopolysaccharide exporter